MNQPTTLAPDDLRAVQEAATGVQLATQAADIVRLRLFVRYGLSEHDSFDLATGKITRASGGEDPAVKALREMGPEAAQALCRPAKKATEVPWDAMAIGETVRANLQLGDGIYRDVTAKLVSPLRRFEDGSASVEVDVDGRRFVLEVATSSTG